MSAPDFDPAAYVRRVAVLEGAASEYHSALLHAASIVTLAAETADHPMKGIFRDHAQRIRTEAARLRALVEGVG
jgi:hypothetical protein